MVPHAMVPHVLTHTHTSNPQLRSNNNQKKEKDKERKKEAVPDLEGLARREVPPPAPQPSMGAVGAPCDEHAYTHGHPAMSMNTRMPVQESVHMAVY